MSLCTHGLMLLSFPVHPILTSHTCSPSELTTALMSNELRTPLSYKSTALLSLTYCGLMSSLTDMSTLTASSQVTMPLTQMSTTPRPLETLTSPSTIHLGHRVSKTIQMHTDWLLAFEIAKEAILFAYPHRTKELNSYRKFIIGQFATFGGDSNLHFHVVNLDRAIRLCVAQTNDISFTSYDQFRDLITHHIVIRGTPDANHQPTPGGSKHSKTSASSDEVCKWWNLGRCMSDSCKYKHGCAICGQPHQAKSCGGFKSGEGPK